MLPVHLNNQWIWKDETDTLELVKNTSYSELATSDKKVSKPQTAAHQRQNDRIAVLDSFGKYCGRYNVATSVRISSARPGVLEHDFVTLHDVKMAAKNIFKTNKNNLLFSDLYFGSVQLDNFLYAILHYFDAFFERKTLEEKAKPMAVTLNKVELKSKKFVLLVDKEAQMKKAIALTLKKEEQAKQSLAQFYGVLLLGLGLEDAHHMNCGRKRNSAGHKDRNLYENLYSFAELVSWIAFRRPDITIIKCELGRLLRSQTFNPATRPKQVQEIYAKDRLKNDDFKVSLSPAEYRRLQPKRPAIKSIVNQRSPVISALIPTSSEAARQRRNRQDKDITTEYKCSMERPKKVGIIGEPLIRFNPETLIELGDPETNHSEQLKDDACSNNESNNIAADQT
ncbi:protein phosphatase 1 regulatory subunit 36-like [Xenia sp. Carnegie-2017]|uniref:protein phosphatase 1 regulatory subunit 36-like n=1 Tax=Xenia sp. Carnegie-2017 TaxID=2897299 RepID=UPI001F03AAB6|nr:protein phosphatase 1 regulatory subunit 36-like [Xenia sp. Carnegie-2017]